MQMQTTSISYLKLHLDALGLEMGLLGLLDYRIVERRFNTYYLNMTKYLHMQTAF